MSKWREVKLGKIVSFTTGKLNSNAAVEGGKYPFYTCSQTIFKTNTFSFDTECIILGGNNANAKYPLFYKKGKFDAYQRNYIIEPKDKNELNIKFLYYYMRLRLEYMRVASTGVTTKFLTLKILKNMRFQIPDLVTQEKIADVLSTYDELIENNNRRIEILEKTAEEIYKEWFVRMRFPGYENTKFIKGIPEGWEVKRVGDLVNRLQAGHFYKEEELLEEGEVIVIDQSTKKYMGFHNEDPTHIADIDNPIILFGDHSCKMIVMTRKFSLGENIIPFISNNNHPVLFLYYSLKGLIQTEEYKRHWKELINKKIYYPEIWLQEKFRHTIKDNFEMIEKYKEQNQNLINQRDLLLPRLMNGTIEVK